MPFKSSSIKCEIGILSSGLSDLVATQQQKHFWHRDIVYTNAIYICHSTLCIDYDYIYYIYKVYNKFS